MRRYLVILVAFGCLTRPLAARPAERLENWFHDPYFQISKVLDHCPIPAGPFVTENEMIAGAHHRAERGTSCWLAGKCDRPTSYAYDQDIAAAIRDALPRNKSFLPSTLWVTVQGRVVYIEGCAADKSLAHRLEVFIMTLPYVELAVAKIRTDPAAPAPYPLLEKAQ